LIHKISLSDLLLRDVYFESGLGHRVPGLTIFREFVLSVKENSAVMGCPRIKPQSLP